MLELPSGLGVARLGAPDERAEGVQVAHGNQNGKSWPAARVVAVCPGEGFDGRRCSAETRSLAGVGLYGQRWVFEQEVTPDDRRDRLG